MNVSFRELKSTEIGGVVLDGILMNEGELYDLELTVSDEQGNTVANISVPLEK